MGSVGHAQWERAIGWNLSKHKAAVSLLDFKECDVIGVEWRHLMRLLFAQIPSDFSFPLPDRSLTILLYLTHNAFYLFRAAIEIDNRMRSIRLRLTCQTPSDSIRFFKIAYDRPIVRSHCPIPHPIFQPIHQTIK